MFFFAMIIVLSCNESPDSETKEPLSKTTKIDNENYMKKGKTIALSTFASLSAELGKALQEGGVATAIEKCNLAAMPMVDSLSRVHKASIRRTSLKVRNPLNKPSQEELMILKAYENQSVQKADLKPMIVENDDQTLSFYAPIKIQELCLNCHGKIGEELNIEDHALIKSLYPNDEAINYNLGDLRGMWSIKFQKE